MATVVFPTVNDVGGSGQGKTIKESQLSAWLSKVFDMSFVVSGLTGGTSANLTLTIAAGECFISGYRVQETTSRTKAITASSSRDVYLQLTRDGSNNVTGTQLVEQAAGSAAPTDSVLLGTATTSASAITGWTDKRPGTGSSLVLQGTFASRPSASRAGRLFWATDTKSLYRDDGSAWYEVSPSRVVRKTADETVTSSTVLQDDDELRYALLANDVVAFEAVLFVVSTSTGDFKAAFTVPAGATLLWSFTASFDTASGDLDQPSAAITASGGSQVFELSSANTTLLTIKGMVVNGGTAGNLQLQWAQSSSTANPTTVKANSYLRIAKVA